MKQGECVSSLAKKYRFTDIQSKKDTVSQQWPIYQELPVLL
jgi:hypothetical protein